MKFTKMAAAAMIAAMIGLSLPAVSFAKEGHEAAFVKLLNESAAALKTSNPSLSSRLSAFANEEAHEKEEKDEKHGPEKKEKNEERTEHLKLLRESAAALRSTHPDLAKRLTERADRNEKKMNRKKK